MPLKIRQKMIMQGPVTILGDTELKDTLVELAGFWNEVNEDILIKTGVTAVTQLKIKHVTGTVVNCIGVKGSVANSPVEFAAEGTDTNIGVRVTPKGTGKLEVTTHVWKPSDADLYLYAGATAVVVGAAKHVASAVNYLALRPSATGNAVAIVAEGTDTDIPVEVVPKGAGEFRVPATVAHTADADVNLKTGATRIIAAVLKHVASAVNRLALTPSATGQPATLAAEGTDTDIDVKVAPKGTGRFQAPCGISGAAPVVLTDAATYDVLAANSGKLHVIPDMTQGCTISLPTEASGLFYEFIYGGAAAEAHNHVITSGADLNFFVGGVVHFDADAGPAADEVVPVYADGNSNSKLTLNVIEVGSRVIVWCDGTRWYVTGTVVAATAPAFADQ